MDVTVAPLSEEGTIPVRFEFLTITSPISTVLALGNWREIVSA